MATGHWRARLRHQLAQIPVTDQYPGKIGQRIPFELEKTEIECVGRQAKLLKARKLCRIGQYNINQLFSPRGFLSI